MPINPHHDDRAGDRMLERIMSESFGFMSRVELEWLATDAKHRLTPILVRCGGCRFTAPAQDVQHLIDIITRDGSDYVRDVSIPVKV